MVDYYTFKISREDARNRILKNEDIVNEKEFKKLSCSIKNDFSTDDMKVLVESWIIEQCK